MGKRLLNGLVLGIFTFTNLSCASIMTGRHQDLPVVSNPAGAIVTISGMKQVSPAIFVLNRKEPMYFVKIEKEGYEPVEITLKRDVNGWVWGNVLLGGLIGLAIDMSVGAAYKLTPKEIDVDLVQKRFGSSEFRGKDILFVKLINSLEGQ
jgi:hypothetical protein